MNDVDLVVDWCSYAAAKYAVMHWHYSKTMPRSKMNTIGVWEDTCFVGALIFSYGATPQIGSPYRLNQTEIVELTRVALNSHISNVTQIIRLAISLIKSHNSSLRLIVSFADTEQGHLGVIYQASNWIYTGTTENGRVGFIIDGKKVHTRTIGSKPGGIQSLRWVQDNINKNAQIWNGEQKHRYLYPLDRAMRRQILPLAKPYPKRDTSGQSVQGDTPSDQLGGPGSSPGGRSTKDVAEP